METVADENPLRSATSRMVTELEERRREGSERRDELAEDGLESGMRVVRCRLSSVVGSLGPRLQSGP